MFNGMKRKFFVVIITMFLLLFAGSVHAARYENFVVGNLTVEKTARIKGLLQAVANTTGNVFYVYSGTGINGIGAAGLTSTKPLATVDYALGRCTANNGDFIIVMAGHAETISAADGFDADVAGVKIFGLGYGTDMPELTFTATDSTVAIGAANVSVFNIRFLAGVSAIVDGVSIEAAGDNFEMAFCEFPEPTTSTFEFVTAINLGSTANYANIHHNTYYNADATGGSHFIEAGDGVNIGLHVTDNLIFGEFLVAGIWSDTADLETLIARNNITNMTTGQYAIEFTGAATGSVIGNILRTDTQIIALDPGSMSNIDNTWDDEDTADSVGIPVVVSSTDSYDQSAKSATGSTAVMVNGNTIFTIAGGPIKIVDLVSICITGNDATATTVQYSANPTVGAATTFSAATATIANALAGAGIVLNQTALNTAPDISAVMVGLGSVSTNKIIINEGIITIVVGVGSTTGTWKHYLRYIPLATGVTVTGT